MKLTKSNEDYLEAIGFLLRERGVALVSDIAASLNVKMPSVTSAIRQLAALGLVEYVQYAPVKLTERGKVVADEIMSSHRTLRVFFKNILHIPNSRANEIACQLEHIMNVDEIGRVSRLTGFLLANPEFMGSLNDELSALPVIEPAGTTMTLDKVRAGIKYVVQKIASGRRNLPDGMALPDDLRVGTELEVIRVAQLGDTISIRYGETCIALNREVSRLITVRINDEGEKTVSGRR